jgi:AcrR family transcriptional regulator
MMSTRSGGRGRAGAAHAEAERAAALTPRLHPTQQRAKDTVTLLLDTAAALLEEGGLDAFNTNLLAERAGVRVRTVYRYFPNKLAVITAMAERMTEEWDSWFGGFEALADPGRDWREVWREAIDAFVSGIRRTPGAAAIRRTMRAVPELHRIDQEDNERLAAELAVALRRRGVELPRARLLLLARTLVETATAVIDLSLGETAARARVLLDDLRAMHIAFLAPYLD